MARPRNEASREAILNAALHCFVEVGYDATTYDQISNQSGISRPLVQHYFPRKSQIAKIHLSGLLSQCISLTDGLVPSLFHDEEADASRLYIVGQVFFGYLCTTGKLLFADVLKSRELTSDIIDMTPVLPKGSQQDSESSETDEIPDGIVSALGGFYELAYRKLSLGKEFNVTEEFGLAMAEALQNAGTSRARANRVIAESILSPTELSEILNSIQI